MALAIKHEANSSAVLPVQAQEGLHRLGQRLRACRIQRGWTIGEMAQRLLCSPTTWRALESGRPGTGIGVLAHALWLLGELDGLDAVAPPRSIPVDGRRVRRRAGAVAPGRIADEELDF